MFIGNWTVDIVEQCLLTNVYFDHLQALQSRKKIIFLNTGVEWNGKIRLIYVNFRNLT